MINRKTLPLLFFLMFRTFLVESNVLTLSQNQRLAPLNNLLQKYQQDLQQINLLRNRNKEAKDNNEGNKQQHNKEQKQQYFQPKLTQLLKNMPKQLVLNTSSLLINQQCKNYQKRSLKRYNHIKQHLNQSSASPIPPPHNYREGFLIKKQNGKTTLKLQNKYNKLRLPLITYDEHVNKYVLKRHQKRSQFQRIFLQFQRGGVVMAQTKMVIPLSPAIKETQSNVIFPFMQNSGNLFLILQKKQSNKYECSCKETAQYVVTAMNIINKQLQCIVFKNLTNNESLLQVMENLIFLIDKLVSLFQHLCICLVAVFLTKYSKVILVFELKQALQHIAQMFIQMLQKIAQFDKSTKRCLPSNIIIKRCQQLREAKIFALNAQQHCKKAVAVCQKYLNFFNKNKTPVKVQNSFQQMRKVYRPLY